MLISDGFRTPIAGMRRLFKIRLGISYGHRSKVFRRGKNVRFAFPVTTQLVTTWKIAEHTDKNIHNAHSPVNNKKKKKPQQSKSNNRTQTHTKIHHIDEHKIHNVQDKMFKVAYLQFLISFSGWHHFWGNWRISSPRLQTDPSTEGCSPQVTATYICWEQPWPIQACTAIMINGHFLCQCVGYLQPIV